MAIGYDGKGNLLCVKQTIWPLKSGDVPSMKKAPNTTWNKRRRATRAQGSPGWLRRVSKEGMIRL